MSNQGSAKQWNIKQSKELYSFDAWTNQFFTINDDGEMCVNLDDGENTHSASLLEMINGIKDRGLNAPLLLRFPDLLAAQISSINEAFRSAIAEIGYQGSYHGVYPVKVNQQQQVIKEVTEFGQKYKYGLEAGSKPELLIALSYMHDPDAYIICNGYKDQEFIDLALYSIKMGIQTILVIEMPSELELILERSEALGIEPALGVRVKLSTSNNSYWSQSSGENSVFGLTTNQVLNVVDTLKASDKLSYLKLLHYHQGSQVPDIRAIREAASEATRIYVELAQEGAPMGLLDIGGGLGIDYDGSRSNSPSSKNYGTEEYAIDVTEVVKTVCDAANVAHPSIISESGRAIAAYYSVLIFNVLDVNSPSNDINQQSIPEKLHSQTQKLREIDGYLESKNIQECYNDAQYYREEILSLFRHGNIGLRERAYANSLYTDIMTKLHMLAMGQDQLPDEVSDRPPFLDVYYGNFSIFQSLPDSWAIDQLFPVMPIHRLSEKPTANATLADITCDCDGRLDSFIINGEHQNYIPLHTLEDQQEYYIGVFLVGAYQETLGDLHNLLGDTNVLSIVVKDGKIQYQRELAGDTTADVLSYVEYDTKNLTKRFLKLAESSVESGRITPLQRREIMESYHRMLNGYTYFTSSNN